MAFPFYFVLRMRVLSPIKSIYNTVMFLDLSPHIFVISFTSFVSSPAKLCIILIIRNNFHVLFASFSLPCCFFPFQIWFWKDGNFLLLFACLSLNLFVLLFTPSYLISPLVLWNSKLLRSYICSCWIVFWELIWTRAWGIFCRRCAGTLVIARVHWGARGIYR